MTMQSPSISLDRVLEWLIPFSTSHLCLGMYVCTKVACLCTILTDPFLNLHPSHRYYMMGYCADDWAQDSAEESAEDRVQWTCTRCCGRLISILPTKIIGLRLSHHRCCCDGSQHAQQPVPMGYSIIHLLPLRPSCGNADDVGGTLPCCPRRRGAPLLCGRLSARFPLWQRRWRQWDTNSSEVKSLGPSQAISRKPKEGLSTCTIRRSFERADALTTCRIG
jgi:hypothetical protein